MSTKTGPRGRRGGGREARLSARLRAVAEKVPFITRTMTPFEVLSAEGLELVEQNADAILEEVGIEFRDPDALATLEAAGAEVEGERVRFPRGMARALVQATARSEFVQHARNLGLLGRRGQARPVSESCLRSESHHEPPAG